MPISPVHDSVQDNPPIGWVSSVKGSEVCLTVTGEGPRVTVGRFVAIRCGAARIVALVTDIAAEAGARQRASGGDGVLHAGALAVVHLMGDIRPDESGMPAFSRGVREYPAIGDEVSLASARDLGLVFQADGPRSRSIGTIQQDSTIEAFVRPEELVNKHFAVVGATGVGKSSAVAVLLRAVMDQRQDLRILLLDGHNEYGRCFGDRANLVTPSMLKLPFWLFNFDELVDVLYGGRPAVPEEIEILAELIPAARGMYGQMRTSERISLKRPETRQTGHTVDAPTPYLLQDLVSLIDERMGMLENRSRRMHYHRLLMRIDTVRQDPRYGFMFENANVGGDTMARLLAHYFRLEPAGKPITVLQLAGLPAEVVDAVVCVFCRLSYEFAVWSEGAFPLLMVCEEAHRYASSDRAAGFAPTRRALARIAKEGRKYRIYLGLVTQRPAELDATIVSQCSTIFAMRMTNDRDQALLRSAVSDAAANLLACVPSLGTREAVAFGEGVAVPARILFRELPADQLPGGDPDLFGGPSADAAMDFVHAVVKRWRGATVVERGADPEKAETRTLPPLPGDDVRAALADNAPASLAALRLR